MADIISPFEVPVDAPQETLFPTVEEQQLVAAQNNNNTSSLLNAASPTPLMQDNNPSGYTSALDAAAKAGSIEPTQLAVNSMAMEKLKTSGAPLTPEEQVVGLSGIGAMPVPANLQGTGAAIATPQASQPVQAAQPSSLPGAIDPFAGSNALAIRGIQSAAKAGAESAAAEHAYFQKKADFEAEAADKQQKLQEAFDFKYQEKLDDYDQAVKEYKNLAGEKIVPAAFLARQDTTGSLMTGLAVALGGIGGALQGTNKNIGLEMIEKAIDRDVAAQQYNLEFKQKIGAQDLQNQQSLLSKMREKFGDDKSAVLATKLAMTELVQSKMNQELTKKGGARDLAVQAQAQTAMAQIVQRKEAYAAQLKAAQAAQYEKQQMMSSGNYYDMSNEQALAQFGKDADKYVRGYGMATDPQLAKDFIQKVKPAEATIQKIKDVLAFTKGKSFNKLSPEDRATMGTMLTDLQLDLKSESAYALGVLTGPDMELLNKITGDPNSFNPLMNSQSRLEQLIKISQKKFDSKVKAYGFDPKSSRPGSIDSLVKPVK